MTAMSPPPGTSTEAPPSAKSLADSPPTRTTSSCLSSQTGTADRRKTSSAPGPGRSTPAAGAARMAFTRAAVTVQDLRCEPACAANGAAAAKVSAVLRFVAPWLDQAAASKRTGLGGATLSAEGAWSASTGRLRMAACLGSGEDACRYRVTLHVPTAFSITRRSIIVGRISATDGSHHPQSFQQRVPPGQNWHQFGRSGEAVPMAYHYAKVEQAGELLRRRKPSGRFRSNFLARFLLSYPRFVNDNASDDLVTLANLAADIGHLHFQYPWRSCRSCRNG